jgi:hypothetical protein
MTAKEILLAQLSACHNEVNSFAPLNNSLAGLTEEQALKKDKGNNSVMQIVTHLIFWNERYLNRFLSIPNPKFEGEPWKRKYFVGSIERKAEPRSFKPAPGCKRSR